jgi:hypothetical protein
MSATASTALAMIPFDLDPPLRFDEVEDRPRDDAEPLLPEPFADELRPDDPFLLDDDPDRADLDAVRDFEAVDELREEEPPDLPVAVRDVEVVDRLLEADVPALDPDFAVLPLLAEDPERDPLEPDPDLDAADDLVPVVFFVDAAPEDLPREADEVDLDVDADLDLDPDAEEPDREPVEDFDPFDLDVDDFDEPAFEPEDFLVVAMIFLRVIE